MIDIHNPQFKNILNNILNNTVIPDDSMPVFDESNFNFNREMSRKKMGIPFAKEIS